MTRTLGIAAVGLMLLLPVTRTNADPVAAGMYLKVAEGTLVKAPDDPRVYLVDQGVLRHVSGTAYGRLYADFGGICTVTEVPESLVQEPLGEGTRLVRAKADAHVWLIDNGQTKRHVSDVPVFNRYGFSWRHVQIVALEQIDSLPVGPRLE